MGFYINSTLLFGHNSQWSVYLTGFPQKLTSNYQFIYMFLNQYGERQMTIIRLNVQDQLSWRNNTLSVDQTSDPFDYNPMLSLLS